MTILAVLLEMGFDSLGVLKVLAVAGGAGVGGLASGFFGQLLSRSLTTQKMPPKMLTGTRLGGAGIGGWLVALWVFGGGGSGLGGGGGFGLGPGAGTGPDTAATASKDTGRSSSSEQNGAKDATEGRLRIEVLGKDTLVKITRKERPDPDRCYRIDDPEGARLLTLAEVKELIRSRRKQSPPLRQIDVIVYNDSPAEDVSYVSDLYHWAQDQQSAGDKMKVSVNKPDQNAPVR